MASVAADGKDGDGLNLKKLGYFFQVLMLYLQKSPNNNMISSMGLIKALSNNLSSELTYNGRILVT